MKTILTICVLLVAAISVQSPDLNAQTRVAVLPFQNINGNFDYTIPCYDLADSVARALPGVTSPENVTLIPPDSVEDVLATLNLDPTNAQYVSDMWKAVKLLKVEKVITGTFNVRYGKIFVNAYIYDVETKLRDKKYQAINLYSSYEEHLSLVGSVVKQLSPFFKNKS